MDELYKNGRLNFKTIPLLCYLSDEEFKKMESRFEVLHYSKGEYIFRSGRPADKMFILYSGFMKIILNLSDGREQMMYLYQAGDFIGGLNLLSGDTYVYDGVALRDTTVITISNKDFRNVLMNNKDFLISIIRKSYERIRRAEGLVDRLSVINADMKVAKSLLDLIKVYGQETKEGIVLNLTLNQEELGSYSGIARETLSRKLKQFEEAGYIKILARNKILLKDIKAMSRLLV
ncbi:MAG: Crp/Fnr family transcriptional regulator [Tissierellia bacterium]|nr:Crp/Fnr family transcriptional regulator [Tissierellia bacterium]